MALPTFTEAELGQSQGWLDQMNRALASRGLADGVQSAIQEAVQLIADNTAKYTLERLRWQRLMQPLAVANLYRKTGNVQPAAEKLYDEAMAELKEIRAGKFKDLPAAATPVQTISPQTAEWYSRPSVGIR